MATSDRWSRTVTSRRGKKVRIYEREPGGVLHVATWVPGNGSNRVSLGHRDQSAALQTARDVLAELDRRIDEAAPVTAPSLTLGEAFRRFAHEARHLPDGSLKTETYLRHVAMTGRYFAQFLGDDQRVDELTPDRIHAYVVWRRAGGVSKAPVGANTLQRDLAMFKAVLNWACRQYDGRRPLLTTHVMQHYKIPSERNPKRPVVDSVTIRALLARADEIHPFLHTLIVLAWRTGRRLSSILALRWDDIDAEAGTIRWRAEHDKIGKTWIVPAHRDALTELARFRAQHPAIGSALLFPHPQRRRHHDGPVTRHLAAWWLNEAFRRCQLVKPAGSLWHMFRRVWATERKDLPLKDVAAVGGWDDPGTLLRYQQPDAVTMRAVVDFEPQRDAARRPKSKSNDVHTHVHTARR